MPEVRCAGRIVLGARRLRSIAFAMTDVVALAAELLTIDSSTGAEGAAVDFVLEMARRARLERDAAGGVTRARQRVGHRAPAAASRSRRTSTPFRRSSAPRSTATSCCGRGACDAKGIAAAMMVAADRLATLARSASTCSSSSAKRRDPTARARRTDLAATSRFLVNGEPTESKLASGAKGSLRVTCARAAARRTRRTRTSGSRPSTPMLELLPTLDQADAAEDAVLGETTLQHRHAARAARRRTSFPRLAEAGDHVPPRRRCRSPCERRSTVGAGHAPSSSTGRTFRRSTFTRSPASRSRRSRTRRDIPLLGRWGTPLLFGPGSIHVAHTPDEYIDVNELAAAVGAYERIVRTPARRMTASPAGAIGAVAVLGATGAVGQAFIRLLADHPWFELAEVAASERSAGQAVSRSGALDRGPTHAGARRPSMMRAAVRSGGGEARRSCSRRSIPRWPATPSRRSRAPEASC